MNYSILINVLDDVNEIIKFIILVLNLLTVDDPALEFDWSELLPTQRAFPFCLTPSIYALEAKFVLATVDRGRGLILGLLTANGAFIFDLIYHFWDA